MPHIDDGDLTSPLATVCAFFPQRRGAIEDSASKAPIAGALKLSGVLTLLTQRGFLPQRQPQRRPVGIHGKRTNALPLSRLEELSTPR